jgi:hypothetical protein
VRRRPKRPWAVEGHFACMLEEVVPQARPERTWHTRPTGRRRVSPSNRGWNRMPGVTACLVSQRKQDDPESFAGAQATMLYEPDYERLELGSPSLRVGFVKYPAYPVRQLGNDPTAVLLLEGRIYNKDAAQVERELVSLAHEIRNKEVLPQGAIRSG